MALLLRSTFWWFVDLYRGDYIVRYGSSALFCGVMFFFSRSYRLLFLGGYVRFLVLVLGYRVVFHLFPSVFFVCYLQFRLCLGPHHVYHVVSNLRACVQLLCGEGVHAYGSPHSQVSLVVSVANGLFRQGSTSSNLFLRFPSYYVLRVLPRVCGSSQGDPAPGAKVVSSLGRGCLWSSFFRYLFVFVERGGYIYYAAQVFVSV